MGGQSVENECNLSIKLSGIILEVFNLATFNLELDCIRFALSVIVDPVLYKCHQEV